MADKITRYSTVTGFAIREIREIVGISQLSFSLKLQISQASWSRIEKGYKPISVEKLVNASALLGVEASFVLRCVEEIVSILNYKGWAVSTERLNEDTADSLLEGFLFMQKNTRIKEINKKLPRTSIGKALAAELVAQYGIEMLKKNSPALEEPKSTTSTLELTTRLLSGQSLAKSTRGRVFDTALKGVKILRKLES